MPLCRLLKSGQSEETGKEGSIKKHEAKLYLCMRITKKRLVIRVIGPLNRNMFNGKQERRDWEWELIAWKVCKVCLCVEIALETSLFSVVLYMRSCCHVQN